MYEELLNPPCYELRGHPDVAGFMTAIFDLFSNECTLVMETSGFKPNVHDALAAISDSVGPAQGGWNGFRYELRLGRPVPQLLIDICEHDAAPAYCDYAFVFRAESPILLWFDFGDDQMTIRPEFDESLVRALVERVGITYVKREK